MILLLGHHFEYEPACMLQIFHLKKSSNEVIKNNQTSLVRKTAHTANCISHVNLKYYYDQKINSFSLDFKTLLTKHYM